MLSSRLVKAISIAAYAHRNQKRKATDIPYICHPYSVMLIVQSWTRDEDVLIAALLHDVLEDAAEEYSEHDMLNDFGPRVMSIVKEVTKDSSLPTWQERADSYLAHLETASHEALIVCLADKTHNLMSIVADYEAVGDALWARFNAGKDRQLWWYSSVKAVLERRLGKEFPGVAEFARLLGTFESDSKNRS
ncbi:bifunctional (p)ppGpp synthetase/guanosine-3',5'-bis(diphosphate) 3'-pyrophosphohydrolase [Corynebacterium belfantii]|uniref:HD domain-containing protein n=1 Tax=Corynebacterium belfantii TaxID=2014537 RepID=UPI0018D2AE63|nr:HD domain-containing protein [Corynebacterium belfantii]MBG9328477.1 bifunctional (p)ppGpp synthetase/guanosine-3',5'-bis(diphosphate) 3'-pyrophosphohydrolase [Corynebacterium belfantii]